MSRELAHMEEWVRRARGPPQSTEVPPRSLRIISLILVVVVVCLAAATAFFYNEYQGQLSLNSKQGQLENGIPISAVGYCLQSSDHRPYPAYFYPLLPSQFQNATISGYGLVSYWPILTNGTAFRLYEIWQVRLFFANASLPMQTTNQFHVELPYNTTCPIANSPY